MQRLFAVPLLVGAGLLVGFSETTPAAGQAKKGGAAKAAKPAPARPPANKPAPRPQPKATPQARPTPRPSTPTPSRPQAKPQPTPQPRPTQPQRPSIGQKPNLPGAGGSVANKPVSRPVSPKPVTPTTKPNLPQVNRPSTLPGNLGGSGTTKPAVKPSLPTAKPGINTNVRPTVRPETRPTLPVTRPGVTLPSRPETKPALPPIGERPNLPNKPDRPNVSWPSKPETLPGRPGTRPDPKFPIDPKFPKDKIDPKFPKGKIDPKYPKDKLPNIPDRPNKPGVNWPNRPAPGRPGVDIDRPTVINRPGINNSGNKNTIINNNITNVNKTVVNQVNQSNNYYNNTNVFRPGFAPGYGGWSGVHGAVYGYNAAWHDNFAYWQRSYHPWYNGAWHGNAFFHNDWGLGGGAVGVGLGLWGLNSLAFSFGYHSYVNPFYVAPPVTVVVPPALNYSQPVINVVQALPESGQEPPPLPETAAQAFDTATTEFKKGNYRTALDKTEQALKDFPNDPAMHEFRALCLFALGDYRQASAAVHAILASGPGWDWTTLSSLYADVDTYVGQLFALEKAAAAKPEDPALWFLLAYHYTTAGQVEAAKDAIGKAQKLLPADQLVRQLAQAAGVKSDAPVPKLPPPPADVQLDITGNWTAPRADGGKIGLSVNADGSFSWSVEDKAGKKDAFDGTFTLEDNVLILERKTGGALMGRVTALAENKFHFKVVGGGESDPGLTFAK